MDSPRQEMLVASPGQIESLEPGQSVLFWTDSAHPACHNRTHVQCGPYDFISVHRDELIRRCRVKVETRSPTPADAPAFDHGAHVPDQLVQSCVTTLADAADQPERVKHGRDLQRRIHHSQVVHDYGDVCQSITDLAWK
jgi:hypothetical protein